MIGISNCKCRVLDRHPRKRYNSGVTSQCLDTVERQSIAVRQRRIPSKWKMSIVLPSNNSSGNAPTANPTEMPAKPPRSNAEKCRVLHHTWSESIRELPKWRRPTWQ
eukprot:scaffold6439_cov167-Amphora_coffeaeformis.AAC.8